METVWLVYCNDSFLGTKGQKSIFRKNGVWWLGKQGKKGQTDYATDIRRNEFTNLGRTSIKPVLFQQDNARSFERKAQPLQSLLLSLFRTYTGLGCRE